LGNGGARRAHLARTKLKTTRANRPYDVS
jgi:hypothetical protein